MSVWVIVVAAGSGSRFGSLKQFEELGGRRVIDWSIETASLLAEGIVVVVPNATDIDRVDGGNEHGQSGNMPRSEPMRESQPGLELRDEFEPWLEPLPEPERERESTDKPEPLSEHERESTDKPEPLPEHEFESERELTDKPERKHEHEPESEWKSTDEPVWEHEVMRSKLIFVKGGSSRSESVRAGLSAVPQSASIVLVHDAARPFASKALFESVISAVRNGADAVVPGAPIVDTVKRVTNQFVTDGTGNVVETIDRSQLVAVQTPQAFRLDALMAAHADGADASDDAGTVESAGGHVVVVPGEKLNFKITEPDDLAVARALVSQGLMTR